MEAMLAGRPAMTMASEDTFGPGVLKQFKNIVLVRPGDTAAIAEKIIRLLTHRELASAIGIAGRLVARQYFAWPEVTSRMEALYASVIAKSEIADTKVA
jgi:glycosyltransferase involved in cell wall biosynthesis